MFGRDDLVPYFRRISIRLPAELRDVFDRTEVRSGISMTVQAPTHAERLHLLHNVHLVYATVTAHATHTGCNVRLMVEVNVVGELVDLDPRNRLTGCVTLTHFQQSLTLRLDARVTVHACCRGRDRGIRSFVDGVMAVIAVHPQISGMNLMAVRNRLNGSVAGVHHPRMREVRIRSDTGGGQQADQNARETNILVCGSRKDECHSERNDGTRPRPAAHSTSVLDATDPQNQTATGPSREFLP